MSGIEVVAHYTDGTLRRGHTWDFRADRPWFQLQEPGSSMPPVRVMIEDLKAVFFVKSLDGNSLHVEGTDFGDGEHGTTRTWVVFKDGEGMAGWVDGLDTHLNGFFLVPVDGASNNERVFVVWGAVAEVLHDEDAVRAARGHTDDTKRRPSSVRRISAAAWREFLGKSSWPDAAEPGRPAEAKPEPERKPKPKSRSDSGLFLQDL